MVEFRDVSKVYPDGTTAVDDLSLSIDRGEFFVLIGPSGCGKTTSLRMINRLEETTGGTILLDGTDIRSLNPVTLRRGIGYVIQEIGLMPHQTVSENISTVPRLLGWGAKRIRKRVDELLELSGLDPKVYRHRLPAQLSGGQQQRIGVLRALAGDPEVVLMDEPFGALDPITKGKLQSELLDLQRTLRKTIVFVTHDIDEALKLADRVVIMRRGKVEQLGTPEELQNEPANDFVKTFIGEDRLAQISPDGSIDLLVEEAPLIVRPTDDPATVLGKMEEHSRETAQIVHPDGRWVGMAYLVDARDAGRAGKKTIDAFARTNRKVYLEEATIRDVAELLIDVDAPVPVVNAQNRLQGLVTNSGVARLLVNRLTRGGGGA